MPPRHAQLFELLRQQENARAAAARIAARAPMAPDALAPFARTVGRSLLPDAARPDQDGTAGA